ncbi:hypothetical protein JKF63_05208 [Porcisia hertigi]|uniref:Trypanosoma Tc-38 (p38) protein domain-containing protein n=1 Tax=Porcisia hertigi TaxID=2761500 RepID=A0A836INE7_9TRYP|nr:hypothetical protein JKF63_05208 [Porcisia hertigi]
MTRLSHLLRRGKSATVELSQTLCGHTFSLEHHHFLSSVTRARGWACHVWVPAPVMELLRLPLANNTFMPVRLDGSSGSVWVYHSAQFLAPLCALREQWATHQRHLRDAERDREVKPLAPQMEPDKLPLNTNGERFDSATEDAILHRVSTRDKGSRYWATAAEAVWLYRAPFTDAYVSDPENGVVSKANALCRPLTFYNVEGTIDPARFSSLTCRRYDPVNYCGRFYRPAVAVRMKAHALQYDCLQEPQWITTHRADRLGLSPLPHITPLTFSTASISLINLAVTSRQSASASGVSPTVASDSVGKPKDSLNAVERQIDEPLLIPLSACE